MAGGSLSRERRQRVALAQLGIFQPSYSDTTQFWLPILPGSIEQRWLRERLRTS